eukprot:m.240208 g.240208  ORF g.240208 m.240208 type:complete len:147 (+) comp10925_c0_seq11:685-1125(+)
MNISSMCKQQLRHALMASDGGPVQWRLPIQEIAAVDVGTVLQQSRDFRSSAFLCCFNEMIFHRSADCGADRCEVYKLLPPFLFVLPRVFAGAKKLCLYCNVEIKRKCGSSSSRGSMDAERLDDSTTCLLATKTRRLTGPRPQESRR